MEHGKIILIKFVRAVVGNNTFVAIHRKLTLKSFLVNLLLITLYTISDNPKYLFIFYGIGVVFFIVEVFDKLAVKNRLIITLHTKVTFLFLFMCSLSLFWSIELGYDYLKFLIFNFFLMFSLNNYIDSREKFDEVIMALILAGIAMSIHILIVSPENFISERRLYIEGYNANSIGLYLSFSTLAVVYFYDKRPNFVVLTPVFLFIPIIFLSGSKKAIFLLLFLITFYLFYKRKNIAEKFKNLMIAIFFISLILYILFSVPWAYEILGTRIIDFIDSIYSGNLGQDAIRFDMIKIGIERFKQKPLIGYGLGNYRVFLNEAIGYSTYSHNNFIELLVSVGLIGFIIYYAIYIYIIRRLVINYYSEVDLAALLLAMMIGLLIIEIGLVSYYSTFYQLIISISFVGLKLVNSKEGKNTWVVKK